MTDRDIVQENTVEVLEAELGCFRAEAVEENHTHNNNTKDEGWVLVKSKPKRKSKKKKTRNPNPANKSSALKPHKTPFTKKRTQTPKIPLESSCCILFAGTNDVVADESDNILEHLERQLTARLSSSAVIVSTVPHRHDLPEDHPVNQRIDLVNFYIEELSIRHEGVELLNFNLIGRPWFTRHGMLLRLPGKRLLADLVLDLVLESLHRCARLFAARLPASPAAAAPACASHSSPPCLPPAALDSTSSTQPPFTAPVPHPVVAYSETAAQELTTNGICQKKLLSTDRGESRIGAPEYG
ncbi:hypothetical protein J6590_063163 [Homalodisca vitripennis]|nr:hypothetical protein J6590_063163 [Homalodisca vitripennis]